MTTSTQTREQWLQSAIGCLRPAVVKVGLNLPSTVHASVGFPSTRALSARKQRIGECWRAESSADGMPHVFISPLLSDSIRVLDVLVHELIHASGIHGHKADFKRPAISLGLTGKMTATVAGPELTECLNGLILRLGPYPHQVITALGRPTKKQTTRLLKAECICGAIIRVTKKLCDDPGLPTCACGELFEIVGI